MNLGYVFWCKVSTWHVVLVGKFGRIVYMHLKIERIEWMYRQRCFMELNMVLCLCVKRRRDRTSVDGFRGKQWNISLENGKEAASSSSCSFWSSSIPIKTKARNGCVRERQEEWKWVHTASQRVDKREIMQSWLKGKGKQVSSLLERQADGWLLYEYICYSLIQSYLYSSKVFFHLGTLLTSLWHSLFNSYYDRMKRKSRDAMFFWFSLMMTRTRKKIAWVEKQPYTP